VKELLEPSVEPVWRHGPSQGRMRHTPVLCKNSMAADHLLGDPLPHKQIAIVNAALA
jgi:hypothetical protein